MKSKIFLYCITLFFISCNTNEKEPIQDKDKDASLNSKLTEKEIERLDFKDFALSPDAMTAIESWEKYKELDIQITYLRKADLSFFKGEKKEFLEFLTEFNTQIPENLQTNAISSRAKVLETKLMLLHNTLILDSTDKTIQLNCIKQVLEAFSNLNFQIDKKLEKDFYDKIRHD